MYKLYSAENSYSMTAQVILEELGLEYELISVAIHIPMEDKNKEWLSYNPNGRVPTLVSADGALYETAAILVSLAENHPEAGLMPPLGDPKRPYYWQWHFYLMSTMQPEELILDSPDYYLDDEKDQDKVLTS
jgi:glutathione S-transferase